MQIVQKHPPIPRKLGRRPKAEAGLIEPELLGAAKQIFISAGYTAATMDAIARHARVSKRTLYALFPSKEALFEAVVDIHIKDAFSEISALTGPQPGANGTVIRNLLLQIAETFLASAIRPESQALDRIVSSHLNTFPSLAARLHQAGFERATSLVSDILRAAGAAQPDLAAEAFYGLVVLAPMRANAIVGRQDAPELESIVDFIMIGSGLP